MTTGRMRTRRMGRALAVAMLVAALGVGCSSGTHEGPGSETTTPAGEVTGSSAAGGTGGGSLLDAVCAGTTTVSDAGTVSASAVTEASGIAGSHRNPGVWWTHNDSGDSARFFALSGDAHLLATVEVDGATALDWEDIAVGPPATSSGGETVYLADIGDNRRSRPSITVYRVAEPAVEFTSTPATEHVTADALTFTYPDGPHDAEALMVDPRSGDLIIVTKDWTLTGHSQVFRAPAGLAAGSTTALQEAATLELPVGTLVTGADVSADGSAVALRSYSGISLYRRAEGTDVWSAFAEPPCAGPAPIEKQGEAIAFAADGAAYATVSEGESPTLHLTHP